MGDTGRRGKRGGGVQGEKEEKLKRGTCPGHSPRETKSAGKKPVKTKVLPNPGQPRRRKPPPQPSPVVGQGGAPWGRSRAAGRLARHLGPSEMQIPWPLHPASWKVAGQGYEGDLVTRYSFVFCQLM